MSHFNLLKPAPVSSRQFHYDAATQSFTAEMSELNGLGRAYNDSCDEGLTMVSSRTGDELVFVVENVDYMDGDLRLWELKSVDGRFTATVFND
jgi:hypothetical protein